MNPRSFDAKAIAGAIDHTLLKPEATAADIDQLCREAIEHQFAAVCVNGRWIARVANTLESTPIAACSVVGFPLGASDPKATAAEAELAVSAGAREIDMVLSIGDAVAGNWKAVSDGVATVLAASTGADLKVILETCLLDDAQIRRACELCRDLGAAFVKTSTGFSSGGATEQDVALMRSVVGPDIGVKASGGIRDRDTAIAMLKAGANRLGCSAGVAIVKGARGASGY